MVKLFIFVCWEGWVSILLIQYVKKTACSIQYNEVISVIFPAKNMQGQV